MERSEKVATAAIVFGFGGILISMAGPDFIPESLRPYLGYGGLVMMVLAGGYIAVLHSVHRLRKLVGGLRMIALLGMIVFGLGFIGSAAVFFWPKPPTMPKVSSLAQNHPSIRTAKEVFLSDFKQLLNSNTERPITFSLPDGENQTITVTMRIYYDFEAKTSFMAFYVTSTVWFKKKSYAIANSAVQAMNAQDEATPVSGNRAGEMTSSSELTFSGRIYIYHESPMLESERDELRLYFKQKNLDVIFRSRTYAGDTAPN